MLDLKNNYKDRRIFIVVLALIVAIVGVGVYAYDKNVIPYINSELGSNYKLENGIYVTAVIRNSPADKAQMKVGDVIIQVDGKELSKMSELRTYIYEKNVGDSIRIKYVRNNKEFQEDIILKKNKTWKNK